MNALTIMIISFMGGLFTMTIISFYKWILNLINGEL